ncbi:MAG: sigma-70 family RNA polymerase sigma factor [Calditrichaeota bacterium]|nr:sigma-70 family RNA polymerase sigma factor [Calditrichota bacterium]MCB9369126.1 sigma-70 family RNA polymerase sigma factor [Calditrichota bacterium]
MNYTPFPETRWTAIRALTSDDEASRKLGWDVVSRLYWHPVQCYVRVKWNVNDNDANDAAQNFFAYVLERNTFAAFDASKSRFRYFLRVCLDRFLINEHRASRAQKRGGGQVGSLETSGADGGVLDPADPESLDELFEQEWRRSLFEAAIKDVEELATTDTAKLQLQLFKRYDIERGSAEKLTYEDLAAEFGVTIATVTNHLHAMRTKVRLALLDRLRQVTATEREFLEESQALLGARSRRAK